MKTIIFDIDGTITSMWPIERLVLLSMLEEKNYKAINRIYLRGVRDTHKIYTSISRKKIGKIEYREKYNKTFTLLRDKKLLPQLEPYPIVEWIKENEKSCRFLYVTGGQAGETDYALKSLGVDYIFDFENSISKSRYRFSKKTGMPFRKIKSKFENCMLVTDSEGDIKGAMKAGVEYVKVDKETFEINIPL